MGVAQSGNAIVPVIAGPTASGKSALALALARASGGTVINADAMQVYDALPILTAQPSAADRLAAPHELYGVLPAETVGSAQLWRRMAIESVAAVQAAGGLPIVVGGTGLYLRALTRGLSPMPDIPPAVRESVRALWRDAGPEAVRERLLRLDPLAAARLDPADRQRTLRALEVVEATGQPISVWQQKPLEGPPEGMRFVSIALRPPREILRAAVADRFEGMVEAGALDEVRQLLARDLTAESPILRAVGFPQLARHVRGEIKLEQAVSEAIVATRQYAKRQETWLRHQFVADFTLLTQFSGQKLPEIFSFIRRYGLTTRS